MKKFQLNILKNAMMHKGKKSEEEKLLEFIDCFEINFDLLNQDINNNYIDFETFANFYEYVAFVYDNDRNFANVLKSTFH